MTVLGKADKAVFDTAGKAVCVKADKEVVAPLLRWRCDLVTSYVNSVETTLKTGEVFVTFVLKMTLTMALCLSEIAESGK